VTESGIFRTIGDYTSDRGRSEGGRAGWLGARDYSFSHAISSFRREGPLGLLAVTQDVREVNVASIRVGTIEVCEWIWGMLQHDDS
jgi:hypothetical protein